MFITFYPNAHSISLNSSFHKVSCTLHSQSALFPSVPTSSYISHFLGLFAPFAFFAAAAAAAAAAPPAAAAAAAPAAATAVDPLKPPTSKKTG